MLVAFLCAWAVFSSWFVGGNPWPLVALGLGAVAAHAAGRWMAVRDAAAAPFAVVCAVALLTAIPMLGRALGSAASGAAYGPLVYANASGALFFVGATAAAMTLAASDRAWVQFAALVGGSAYVLAAVGSGSRAVLVLLPLLPAGLFATGRARTVLSWLLGAVVVVTIGLTLGLGAAYRPAAPAPAALAVAEDVFTGRRLELWHEAPQLVRERPLTGAGPGSFALVSPVAAADADAFDPHSAYLLAAVELGVPGGLLAFAIVLWALAALLLPPAGRLGTVAATAVAAVAVQAAIDHVLRAPALVLLCAALVGAGSAWQRRASREAAWDT